MLSCRTAFGLGRSCPSQIFVHESGWVQSVGYWVESGWVKKFRPKYISGLALREMEGICG